MCSFLRASFRVTQEISAGTFGFSEERSCTGLKFRDSVRRMFLWRRAVPQGAVPFRFRRWWDAAAGDDDRGREDHNHA